MPYDADHPRDNDASTKWTSNVPFRPPHPTPEVHDQSIQYRLIFLPCHSFCRLRAFLLAPWYLLNVKGILGEIYFAVGYVGLFRYSTTVNFDLLLRLPTYRIFQNCYSPDEGNANSNRDNSRRRDIMIGTKKCIGRWITGYECGYLCFGLLFAILIWLGFCAFQESSKINSRTMGGCSRYI